MRIVVHEVFGGFDSGTMAELDSLVARVKATKDDGTDYSGSKEASFGAYWTQRAGITLLTSVGALFTKVARVMDVAPLPPRPPMPPPPPPLLLLTAGATLLATGEEADATATRGEGGGGVLMPGGDVPMPDAPPPLPPPLPPSPPPLRMPPPPTPTAAGDKGRGRKRNVSGVHEPERAEEREVSGARMRVRDGVSYASVVRGARQSPRLRELAGTDYGVRPRRT